MSRAHYINEITEILFTFGWLHSLLCPEAQYYWNTREVICCWTIPQFIVSRGTVLLRLQWGYLLLEGSTFYCAQRQQHYWNNRDDICCWTIPQFIVPKVHIIIEITEMVFVVGGVYFFVCRGPLSITKTTEWLFAAVELDCLLHQRPYRYWNTWEIICC